jgi:purine-binding chemotaxis protein CheW
MKSSTGSRGKAMHEEQDILVENGKEENVHGNKYLLFRLGNETYGVNILHVTDIIELQKITEVPDMPDYIRGVINLRGQVIPVMDLRMRFKLDYRKYDDRTCIIIVDIKDQQLGFIVDTVSEVLEISEGNIDPSPEFRDGGIREHYIMGLGKIEGEVKILIDAEHLVRPEEVAAARQNVS